MKLEYSKIEDVLISKGIIIQKLFVDSIGNILFFMCKTRIHKKIFFIRVSEKYEITKPTSTGVTTAVSEKIKKVDGLTDVQLNYMIESFDDNASEYEILSFSELSIDVLLTNDSKFNSYIYDETEAILEVPKVEVEQSKIDSLIQKSMELNQETKVDEAPKVVVEDQKVDEVPSADTDDEDIIDDDANDGEDKGGEDSPDDESIAEDEVVGALEEDKIDALEEFKELPENKAVMNKYTSSFYVCIEISAFFKKERTTDIEAEVVSFTHNLSKRLSKMKERRLKQISEFFMNISKELENKVHEFKQEEIKINNDISKLTPHLLAAKAIINRNVSEVLKKEAKELYSNISLEVDKLNEKLRQIKDDTSDLLSKFEIAIEKLKTL